MKMKIYNRISISINQKPTNAPENGARSKNQKSHMCLLETDPNEKLLYIYSRRDEGIKHRKICNGHDQVGIQADAAVLFRESLQLEVVFLC